MNIPQIQIHQTFGQINIKQTTAKLDITQPSAHLNMQQKPAHLSIQTEQGQIHIDQAAAFAEEGLKNPVDLAKELGDQGRQAVLNKIARIAEEGQKLGRIDKGYSIVNMVKDRLKMDKANFSVGLTHRTAISITYRPTQQKISVEPGGASFEPVVQKPQITVTPGGAQTTVAAYPAIQIDVRG